MNNNLNIHSLIHRMRYVDVAVKTEDVIGKDKYFWMAENEFGIGYLEYIKHDCIQGSMSRSRTLKRCIKEGHVPGVLVLARETDEEQHWPLRLGYKTHYFVFYYLFKAETGEVLSEMAFSVPLYAAYPNKKEHTIKNFGAVNPQTLAKIYKRVTGEK